MRGLERRLAAIESRLPPPVPLADPALAAFLGALTVDELRVLEVLAARLADKGLELAVAALDKRQDVVEQMSAELLAEVANYAAAHPHEEA